MPGYGWPNTYAATGTDQTTLTRLRNVSWIGQYLAFLDKQLNICLDFHTKFSAIHREYSPNPRKFYGWCTSVTVRNPLGHFFPI
jgi:hypothetical protein